MIEITSAAVGEWVGAQTAAAVEESPTSIIKENSNADSGFDQAAGTSDAS